MVLGIFPEETCQLVFSLPFDLTCGNFLATVLRKCHSSLDMPPLKEDVISSSAVMTGFSRLGKGESSSK